MQLGHQLITNLLSDPLDKTNVKHVKGVYTQERDFAIACRLYFHYKIKGLRYDVAIEILNKEFYLGETTLAQIIMRKRDTIEELKNLKADSKYLQKQLPHYNWF
ncbi:hypothetical protein [Mucilaginibacter rubeus]|uniref:Uncharacterized protein n=1 Tax=Mucilaginibacter rubeus TaxID=2027860 RepID=A0A5C1I9N0_9SPHI|nr:hypothetical protein [Mucilaginibacter rubeus]QEM13461.1 hypothetical protein DEO27_026775 [Mucilaginibacter rubeus]